MKLTTQFATVFLAVAGAAFSQDWDAPDRLEAQHDKQAVHNKSAQLARENYDTCVETHKLTGPPVPTPYLACVHNLIIAAFYKGMAAAVDENGYVPADKFAQLMAQQKAALQKASYSVSAALARNQYLSCLSSPDGLAKPLTCQPYLNAAEKYDKLAALYPQPLPK